jgi:hypothetical protein
MGAVIFADVFDAGVQGHLCSIAEIEVSMKGAGRE